MRHTGNETLKWYSNTDKDGDAEERQNLYSLELQDRGIKIKLYSGEDLVDGAINLV